MKKSIYFVLCILYFAVSCQPDQSILTESGQSLKNARITATTAPGFGTRLKVGTVRDPTLDEISGVVQSRTNSGGPYLWVHEDSGNPKKIYLLNEQGFTQATVTLASNDENRDWEDIAIGPGPNPNTWYIYLADIGDNGSSNDKINIYRFIEPSIAGRTLPYNVTLSNSDVQKLEFRYVDGPRNAETLMIDPLTRDLYIFTKEASRGGLYRAAYPQATTGTTTLSRLTTINIPTATAGDISANGTEFLIKNYTQVHYWRKSTPTQSISQLLRTNSTTLPYTTEPLPGSQDPGGEAIGWRKDGSGYYTISELKDNVAPAIYLYLR